MLEDLFLKAEAKFVALCEQCPSQGGVAAVEHGDLAHVFLLNAGEHRVPVGTPGQGSGLQASYQVSRCLAETKLILAIGLCQCMTASWSFFPIMHFYASSLPFYA